MLNQIFDYAALHHNCIISQYVFPRKKKHSRPVGILDLSEQTRLLRCLYDRMDEYKLGIVVCIFTGLRLGEICSLKWRDIDLDRRVLHVNTTVQRIAVEGKDTKTVLLEGEPKSIFSKREIPLPDELVDLLIPYRSNAGEYVISPFSGYKEDKFPRAAAHVCDKLRKWRDGYQESQRDLRSL